MRVAAAEFAKRRLAQKNRSGGPQLRNGKSFAFRLVVAKQHGPERRLHTFDVDLVFDDDGNAVQGPDKARFFECRVEFLRLLNGKRIDGDERIEAWALLVIGADTFEIHLYEFAG